MKKINSTIMVLAMIAALSFNACSSGSDDEDKGGNNPLVGVWKSLQPSSSDSNVYVEVLTFNTNGSGMVEYYNQKEEYHKTTDIFNYSFTSSTFTLDFGDGEPEIFHYSISGNEMKTDRHAVGGSYTTYTKQ